MVTYIDFQCGKHVRKQGIKRHVDERHGKDAYRNFIYYYIKELGKEL
jgi:hypothetical protein